MWTCKADLHQLLYLNEKLGNYVFFFRLLHVRFGESDLGSGFNENTTVIRAVKKTNIHPHYNKNSAYFNLAILEIDPVPLSASIRTICLPERSSQNLHLYDFRPVSLSGWGTLLEADKPPHFSTENLSIYEYR